MSRRIDRLDILAPVLCCVAAALQAWPLPLQIASHVTGPPGGDTAVYVWNQWVFRHELLQGNNPLFTTAILPLGGPADLSLHNYTVFANLVAFGLQPLVGVIAAFNITYLLNVALAGWAVYLLARRVTGEGPAALVAGLFFAWSPFLVARSTAHFSLVGAAPLAFFVLWLDTALERRSLAYAGLAGVATAWAAYSDLYYAAYCLMLGAAVAVSRACTVAEFRRVPASVPRRGVDLAILIAAILVATVAITDGWRVAIGALTLSMRSLYTPMLVLAVLLLLRFALTWRVRLGLAKGAVGPLIRITAVAGMTTAALIAPVLVALTRRALEGRMVPTQAPWRSSAPGVDLLSLAIPNPAHPLAPDAVRDWITRLPNGYTDEVASLSYVAITVIVAAWYLARLRPPALWLAVTAGAVWMALGPFIHVAGVDTAIPTPWALARYLPVIGMARMPSRLMVLATIGVAVMLAAAIAALANRAAVRRPRARLAVPAMIALALGVELLPAPRHLYEVRISRVFDRIAADPRPVRVLTVPFGIRDGLSLHGEFLGAYQLFQTRHDKGIVGGYLSRVSRQRVDAHLADPVLGALVALAEGRTISAAEAARARAAWPSFVDRWSIGYVVIDRDEASAALRSFAVDELGLSSIEVDSPFELHVPRPVRPASAPPG